MKHGYLVVCSCVRAIMQLIDPDKASATFSAALLVSALESLAVIATAFWVNVVWGLDVLKSWTRPTAMAFFAVVLGLTWFGAFRGDRLDRFDSQRGRPGSTERSRGNRLGALLLVGAVCYIVLAYVALALRYRH